MKKSRILLSLVLFGFLLGVYEGKIALWRDHQTKPMKVLPYEVSMLPKADQESLKKGIHFDSLSELYQFAQDYLS